MVHYCRLGERVVHYCMLGIGWYITAGWGLGGTLLQTGDRLVHYCRLGIGWCMEAN